MYVVATPLRDFSQQRAVDRVYDGAVEFPWTVESHTVVIEICHENILHLQKAPRVKQRQCIAKTFQCP